MTEHKAPYTVGNMNIHDAGEQFSVRIDYNELNLETGRSEHKQFFSDTLATDAAAALAHALKVMIQPYPPKPIKIWGLTASVAVAGDVLRDKLDETLPQP